ncbi:FAD-dependent monooxygenase [Longispora urticae]
MDVLISGASVAGPALAYWLGRAGHQVTVVEIAPAPRTGGYSVDFRGGTHLSVLRMMGVLDELRALDTGGTPYRFVAADGSRRSGLPGTFAGGDLEVARSELSRVLRGHSAAEYVYGDAIAAMTETATGVLVDFERGESRVFDLVVGADGMHSGVRRLAFGPEERFVRHLGCHVAGWELPCPAGVDRTVQLYNEPGRMASVGAHHGDPSRASTFFAFRAGPLDVDRRDVDAQRKLLADRFAGMGWRTGELLDALWNSPGLYFDAVSRVDAPSWSRGRIVLLGDAGYGATVGGMGTGTAVVAAYVLAGELALAGAGHGAASARGGHEVAFAAYERRLRGFVRRCQRGGRGTGAFLAPATAFRIRMRDRVLNSRRLSGMLMAESQKNSTGVALPSYPL